MTKERFLLKYDISVDSVDGFLDFYVRRFKEDPSLIKLWHPIKLLNMCKDVPIKWLSEEYPEDFTTLRHLMSTLEDKIHKSKNRKDYYKYQIKPFLKDGYKF